MWQYNYSDDIYHYGVKGMKWGVRRDKERNTTYDKRGKKKDHKKNLSFVTDEQHGKEARLKYRRISYQQGFSLVEINLETGRSHQIRVQFSSRGFPLVGDAKYNPNHDGKTNVALFAKRLSFYHPVTKEKLSFELDMPKRYPFNLF